MTAVLRKPLIRPIAAFLAALPLALGVAYAADTTPHENAELKYQAGGSPLANEEMHQNINPKAPPDDQG